MKVIREEDGDIFNMMPLFCDWGIRRCNVTGCRKRPTTIITKPKEGIPAIGLCEEHYQKMNVPGGSHISVEFDEFDAFKQEE